MTVNDILTDPPRVAGVSGRDVDRRRQTLLDPVGRPSDAGPGVVRPGSWSGGSSSVLPRAAEP